MALASVLLPVPLGPMMACTSPCLIVRVRPLTMGLSPMLMERSLISSWLMSGRGKLKDESGKRARRSVRGGLAAEVELDGAGVETGGQDRAQLVHEVRRQLDIVDLAGRLVVKMGVLVEVRAVAGRGALEVDLAHQAAADERLKAVVDRGEGDARHHALHAGENFVSSGVVALFEDNFQHDLTLGGGADVAGFQLLAKLGVVFVGGGHGEMRNRRNKSAATEFQVRIRIILKIIVYSLSIITKDRPCFALIQAGKARF